MHSHSGTVAARSVRDAVLASPALQARLGQHEDPAAFAHEVRSIADMLGLDPDAALTTLADPGPDPLGISRFEAAPVTLDRWPATGWLPVRAVPGAAGPAFDWAWFGDRRLSEPLFEDSVIRMASRPLSRILRTRTDLAALIAGAADAQLPAPDGLVFHMSRCGSTLVAQMLAAVPQHIVASEAAPVDAVVQWALTAGAPTAQQVAALQAIVAAIGRRRAGDATRYFLKLDAWHVLALPLFRAAFPATPWIFLYRDPGEVMVSHMAMPGMHFSAGMAPGIAPDPGSTPAITSIEDQGAAVLARYLDAATAQAEDPSGMLVNYAELTAAMESRIPAHFGFTPSATERAAMLTATQRYSKAPDQAYADDRARKRAAVTPAIAAAITRHLSAPYDRIEVARRKYIG
ncbi:sulfotransferase [Sphingomonas sp.]|uniref:sulfotransferase n=1 Tax=Sphingomonas sp. TaxID=28214 RepID=UPI00307FBB5D